MIRRYPFIRWHALKPRILSGWGQGEHFLVVGGTGSGKTTILGECAPRRKRVNVCVSKGTDSTLSGPYFKDYEIIRSWPPRTGQDRVMLWPTNKKTLRETRKFKGPVFQGMFDNVLLHEGYWCIAIDETHYMSSTLGLEPEITDMMEQGRSHFITMWNNTQRPADIPVSIYVNSLHACFFSTQEEYDVRRLGRMRNTHTNTREMMANIEHLDKHEFVYLDRNNRIPPCRSIVEKRKR